MSGLYKIATIVIAGISIILNFTGCKSLVTVPINDNAHVRVTGAPFDDQYLVISYNWTEPGSAQQKRAQWKPPIQSWDTEIRLNGLGTVFATNRDNSPALDKIESVWHVMREEDRYGLSALEDLSHSKKLVDVERKQRPSQRQRVAQRTASIQMPLSMFSIRPHW